MHPIILKSPGAVLFQIGPITIRWYGVMIALGFLCAAHFAGRLARRRGLDADRLVNLSLVSFLGGVLGARLYFVALNLDTYMQRPQEILATWLGGMSIHGGIIGGLLSGLAYARLTKLPHKRSYADIFAVVLPLGQAIGRWGNFFNSEAFGKPVLPGFLLALYIPPEARPVEFSGFELFHPAFLYESLWNLAIFLALYLYVGDRLRQYPGVCFLVYLALYSLGRLLIEPVRTDSIMSGDVPVPVIASAVCLVISLALVPLFVKAAKLTEESPPH